MFVMSLKAQNINVGAVVSIWTERIQNEILRWIWLLIYLKMPNLQVYVCMFAIIYNLYGFFSSICTFVWFYALFVYIHFDVATEQITKWDKILNRLGSLKACDAIGNKGTKIYWQSISCDLWFGMQNNTHASQHWNEHSMA